MKKRTKTGLILAGTVAIGSGAIVKSVQYLKNKKEIAELKTHKEKLISKIHRELVGVKLILQDKDDKINTIKVDGYSNMILTDELKIDKKIGADEFVVICKLEEQESDKNER